MGGAGIETNLRRVTVLGSGTMGHGIAHVAALAGCSVRLRDVDDKLLESAVGKIRSNLRKGVEKGKVDARAADEALARIETTTDLAAACAEADLVIEAIPESVDLKRRVFAEVERAVPPACILASNTSSLSIDGIAHGVADPGRVVGMHFFNPPYVLRLVEVVRGARTREDVVAATVQAARHMGKTPIVVKDSPGFASSRLGVVLGLEAMRMVEQGVASASDIDTALELGYGHPMGPLRTSDLVGLDVRLAIAEHLHRELRDDTYRPPEVLRRLVREGKLGKKTGQGFYRWDGDSPTP
ncbi:MAG TPA: 3-hydroxyacyl-CoA dehydrogenase family protein [Candidatus Thermoplasmatota archaeon]|nr:3-hydroxyacyl-CoA dehydrogenase family protein [Candidatus Thermoplasmatota archaeon]